MKRLLHSTPRWVLVLAAVAVIAAVVFIVVHLSGGGMAGTH